MARALDEQQQREVTAFVNRLATLAGYKTTAAWARESGYPASNLSRLRNGSMGVDGYNLVRLIRAAAERASDRPEVLAVAAEGRGGAASSNDSVHIESRLEEVADLAAENFEILKQQIADVARRLPPEGEQVRTEEAR